MMVSGVEKQTPYQESKHAWITVQLKAFSVEAGK